MVPHVPVCMYAHVREGDMHIAERVKKKTGTKWDRDQPGRATGSRLGRVEGSTNGNAFAVEQRTREEKRISGLLWPFLGNPKKDR